MNEMGLAAAEGVGKIGIFVQAQKILMAERCKRVKKEMSDLTVYIAKNGRDESSRAG